MAEEGVNGPLLFPDWLFCPGREYGPISHGFKIGDKTNQTKVALKNPD
jgi:hypothetical protein